MATNPILEEIYAARTQIMAEYGNDLGAYLRDAAERTKASGHPTARIKQRSVRCTGAAKPGELAMANQSSPPGNRILF